MFTNRFSTKAVVFVFAITLTTVLAVNTRLEQPQNAQALSQAINPDTYYPLPPGKQTILVDAARLACLHPDLGIQPVSRVVNPDTYYPLPPGKQTMLVNAAREACFDQGIDTLTINQSVHSDTYYPLPPGKQTILVNTAAARRACVNPGHGIQTFNDRLRV